MNPTDDIYKIHSITKGKGDEPIDEQQHHRPKKIQRIEQQQQQHLHYPSHHDDDNSFIEDRSYHTEEHKSDTIITSYSSNNNNTTTIHSNSEQQQQQQIIQFHHQQQYKRVLINQAQSLIHDFNHNNNHNSESNIARIDDFAQHGIELFKSYYRSSSSRSSSSNVQSKEIIQNDQQGVGQEHNFPTTNTNDRKVYQVLQQLHGILFLWLDYIISSTTTSTHDHPISSILNSSTSSSSSVWDVTNIDCYQIQQKLITATNHICTCIIEIYRFVIHNNNTNNMIQEFTSIESLMILINTLLLLTKPLYYSGSKNNISNHQYNDILQQQLPLLEVIHCTIHHVHIFEHDQCHHHDDDSEQHQEQYQQPPIPLYVQQQFILCLVQSSYVVSVSPSHDAKTSSSSSSSSSTLIQNIAYEIIQYLYQELHQHIQNSTIDMKQNINQITSEQKFFKNGNNNNNNSNNMSSEILVQYYKIALDIMVPVPNIGILNSNPGCILQIISNSNLDTTTLSIELFRIHCIIIQLSYSNSTTLFSNSSDIIPTLLQTFFNHHNNSTTTQYHKYKHHGMIHLLIQHQILDCLVCIAFGWNGSVVASEQDTIILDTIHTLLSDAFIHILIDVKASTTTSSKNKIQIRDTISNIVVLLKRKAIEGLQYLLTSKYNLHDMILHGCTIRNKNKNDADPSIRIQALIQSIFLLCIHDKEYNNRATYSDEYDDDDDYDDDDNDTDHENDIDDDYNVNNEIQLYDDLNHDIETYTINDYTITTGTAEILLSIISLALHDYNNNNNDNDNIDINNSSTIYGSLEQIVPVCIELMQYYCNPSTMNEHILYLIIYMICDEYKELFLHHNVIIQYPDLLTSLSLILQTIHQNTFDENDTSIQRRILYYFYELLIHDNHNDLSISSLFVRQDGIILEAITCIISNNSYRFESSSNHNNTGSSNNNGTTIANNISIQDIAIQIVCILSNNAFDRCILARQPKLLSSMIHYVRNYNNDHHDSTIFTFNNNNNNIDTTSSSSLSLSTVTINDPTIIIAGSDIRRTTATINTNNNNNNNIQNDITTLSVTSTLPTVSTTSMFYSREQIKQCIQQLADVL